MKKVLFASVTLVLMLSLLLSSCSNSSTPSPVPQTNTAVPAVSKTVSSLPKNIVMDTQPIGAVTYVVATGWADVISKDTSIMLTIRPQAGSNVFMPKVNSGESDMAVDLCTTLSRAYNGEAEFQGKRMGNLRSLWLNRVQKDGTVAAVKKSSKYYDIIDLKGARVASDYGAVENVIRYFQVAFAGAGMTWNDVVKIPVPSHVNGFGALQEGRVDATFMMGISVPALQELHASIGIRLVGYPKNPDEIPEFKTLLPGMSGVLLKQTTYPALMEKDTWGQTQPFWYFSSTNMSELTAYTLVKSAWENYEKIQPVHPGMKEFNPKLMPALQFAPYHDGALKFYKEKGVWTEQLEKQQQLLLSK